MSNKFKILRFVSYYLFWSQNIDFSLETFILSKKKDANFKLNISPQLHSNLKWISKFQNAVWIFSFYLLLALIILHTFWCKYFKGFHREDGGKEKNKVYIVEVFIPCSQWFKTLWLVAPLSKNQCRPTPDTSSLSEAFSRTFLRLCYNLTP